MTFDQIGQSLLSQRWTFAKTMPDHPHWYTLRKEWTSDSAFAEAVDYIRQSGYPEIYKGRRYTMLNINEHKYWTMGAPIPSTILINRAHHHQDSEYDKVAPVYDALFSDPESVAENVEVMAMLPQSDHVLDIGCGSGLYLDYCPTERYLGIDPSQKMLSSLICKHPNTKVIQTGFENFIGDRADLVISLFGSANYIQPDKLHRVLDFVSPGGCYVVMFYKPDYSPVVYTRSGITLAHYDYDPRWLPGTVTEYHNFLIVQGHA